MELVVTTGAISRAKLQSNCHHQQTNIQRFTSLMPFLSPIQYCWSTERMPSVYLNTVFFPFLLPPTAMPPVGPSHLHKHTATVFTDGVHCRPNMLATGLQSSVVELLISNADVLFPDGTFIFVQIKSNHCWIWGRHSEGPPIANPNPTLTLTLPLPLTLNLYHSGPSLSRTFAMAAPRYGGPTPHC